MSATTIADCAEEASFQLDCARSHIEWMGCIARAITLDVQHNHGRDVATLAQLAKYIDDTGLASTDRAIDHFTAMIAKSSAPRNERNEVVSRSSAEVPQ